MSETLGKYRIDGVLSAGGSATTFKAYDLQLDRPVLLKVLHPSLARDETSVERFSREARAVAKIRHEGIVHIYDYGRADGQYYIAMEYVEGLSLAELLGKRSRLPPDVAAYIAIQSGRSLGYAHSMGIVHRDVKPGNIIIACDGSVKVTDFGLAYSESLSSITVDGELFGTPSYMSPEQIKGEKVDPRTDVYSLGLTLYEMLSGVQPFKGNNYSAIITKKLTESLPPLKKIMPDCPQRLIAAVNKMTDRSVGRRFQSMDDLVEELAAFSEESGASLGENALADYLSKDAEVQPVREIRGAPTKRSRTPLYAAVLALLSILVVFTGLKLKPRKSLEIVQIPLPGYVKEAVLETGTVFVTSDPAGASIVVDGVAKQSTTPASIADLEPGDHEVSVILNGYRTETRTVSVGVEETSRVGFVLRPLAGVGFLKVSSNPRSAVYVDGDSVDVTPLSRLLTLKRGSHELLLRTSDLPDYISKIEITSGRTTDVYVDLTRIWPRPPTPDPMGYARINVEPWAVVYVDGDSVDTTPFNKLLRLSQGRHRLVLSNPNFPDCAKSLDVVGGETTQVFVDLENEFGYLMLTVEPWADVYVDGEYRDTTPLSKPIPVLPGEHLVKLVGPASSGWEKRLRFERGKTVVEKVVIHGG
jgi:serine/threonine-protein kinase